MIPEGLGHLIGDLSRAAATAEARANEVRDQTLQKVVATAQHDVAVRTGATRDSISAASGEAGPTTDYAPFVERGTYKDPPQPFVEPAADQHTPEFVRGLEDVAGDI